MTWNVLAIPLITYLAFCVSPIVAVMVFIIMCLVLTSNSIASAILLATYLPRPLGHCQNADKWEFSPEKPTIFQVLAQWGLQNDSVGSVCSMFINVWRIEIALR
jgi:hypothetical protein